MSFMQPETYHGLIRVFETNFGTEVIPDEYYHEDFLAGKVISEETIEGWCGRMSAPGYLDCTEWSGPYESEETTLEELKELYGN